ncbi:hypothetical protein KR067_004656, partial [Drosophila pandora]
VDQNLFRPFLDRDFPELKNIKDFKLESVGGKGENYTTCLLRAKFELELNDGSLRSTSYMAKSLPLTRREQVSSWKVFDKEHTTYRDYVSDFEKMYKDAGKNVTFAAKYYPTNNKLEEELLILEDLGQRGFRNANRLAGLDLVHTKATLEKLAQFHAASAVRFELKGAYPAAFDRNICSKTDDFKEFRVIQSKSFVEALPLYKSSHLKSDVESYASEAEDMFQACAPRIEGEFSVLNHGDAWCNNFMFQYDEAGHLKETYFVDLQMCRYSSPAQDLLYFILSSTDIEFKIAKFDYLVKFYHEKLTENLQLLKYPKELPSLRSLHQSLFNHADWIFPIVSILLPIVLLEGSDDSNMDTMMDNEGAGDKFRNNMFQNSRIIRHQKEILPWAFNRGTFEVRR